jgi:hypothetical protein
MAEYQALHLVTDPPPSGASPLPHLFRAEQKHVHINVTIGAIYVCNQPTSAPKRNISSLPLFIL